MDGNKASYLPMDTYPLSGDDLPKDDNGAPMNGWLLFFDELPAASKAVQAAAYKILLDRQVGRFHLHDNVVLMAAGNLVTDNAVANQLSSALRSRMINAQLVPNIPDWMEWAQDPDGGNIHHYITSFLQFKGEALYNFDPDSPASTYASPRTWEFASRLLHQGVDPLTPVGFSLMTGTIGITAVEFQAFVRNYGTLPTIQQIMANPTGADIPSGASSMFALSGSLTSWLEPGNLKQLMPYIDRLQGEYQYLTIKNAVMRKAPLRRTPEIQKWLSQNSSMIAN